MFRFTLLITVILFSIYVANNRSLRLWFSPPPPPNQMDHFWFVQSWPPGYCLNHPCKNPAMVTAQFIIHGLWPVSKTGSTLPGDPKAASFDEKDIKSDPFLYKAMNQNWPSLNGPNIGFWSHEWKKHGSADPAFNNKPLTFFDRTIAVKNLQGGDLLTSLMNKQINPGSSASKNNYKEAMESSIGVQRSVILKCYKDSKNILHLSEVYICVDAKPTKFIACSEKGLTKDTCGTGNVKLDDQ